MTPPPSTTATRLLLLALAALWLAFALIVAINAHPSYQDATSLRWAMVVIALAAAGMLAVLATRLRRRDPISYWFAVSLLGAMVLAGLLDEIGLADLVYFAFTLAPLALLLKDREWYLSKSRPDV